MEIDNEELVKQLMDELRADDSTTRVEIYVPHIENYEDMEMVAPVKIVAVNSLLSACYLLNELDIIRDELVATYPEIEDCAKFLKDNVDKYTIFDDYIRTDEEASDE